ncbi:PFL family protein [Eubacteriales bacterium OttesenSCG-928-G02]|nr:PFL family protein [Eubacteriales bacterium OttesenSCG-928-G02]
MNNFNTNDILETINMINHDHLDIRTITMGISLLDCVNNDINTFCNKIYDKITSKAKNLCSVGNDIEKEYGIPIINKRISVTPIAIVGSTFNSDDFIKIAHTLDKAVAQIGVDIIGGYSALVQKGMTNADINLIMSIPEALSQTKSVCSSINVASTKAGINMDAVALMGNIIKQTAEITADRDSIGCTKLVVFANAPEDNPFMAGAFHGVGEGDCVINVGVSGPGVVRSAIDSCPEANFTELSEIIKKTAFKITRVGQLVAREASRRLDVPFGILDLSLAPTPAVGDSVARIIESMGIKTCGGYGTTAALALLNDAVKKGGTMASSQVGGLSGAFIPVSEDEGMIEAVNCGALNLEKLEAMTAVCSVGLDMIAIPGETSASVIAGIIADEISIGVANTKTTAVRIIPAVGKKVGDKLIYGGLFGEAPVMQINQTPNDIFINRTGRIPAPIHSLKN